MDRTPKIQGGENSNDDRKNFVTGYSRGRWSVVLVASLNREQTLEHPLQALKHPSTTRSRQIATFPRTKSYEHYTCDDSDRGGVFTTIAGPQKRTPGLKDWTKIELQIREAALGRMDREGGSLALESEFICGGEKEEGDASSKKEPMQQSRGDNAA